MARARTLKPGFFTSEQLALCSPLARLLFAGLWTICDRAGKLRDRPRKIKAELMPYEAVEDADAWLDELSRAGLVQRYAGPDGQRYLKVNEFLKHQNPHPKEPPSEIPEPCNSTAEPDLSASSREKSSTSPAVSPLPITHSPFPTTGRSARLGVGHPAFEAATHWTTVAWPKVSPDAALPVTTDQAQRLARLSAQLTPAEVKARMDRAVEDPWWRAKLTLDAFLDNPDRFAARRGGAVPAGKPPATAPAERFTETRRIVP